MGEKAINDRDLKLPDESEIDNPIQFDKNGNVKSVTVKTRSGHLVTIEHPEKALDIAIQLRAQELGEVPDDAFNEIYNEVQKTIKEEVPKYPEKIGAKENEKITPSTEVPKEQPQAISSGEDWSREVESTAKALNEKGVPNEIVKEGFTEANDLNKIYNGLKQKYGDKKGSKLYEVANRLVNPNKNTIVEIRGNGVVVKENGRYILKPFGNTDANPKQWTLYKGMDITNQFVGKIAEEYHNGSNPELVAAVEDLLGKPKAVTPNVEEIY